MYKIEEFLQSVKDKEFLLQAKNYRNKSYAHIDKGSLHTITNSTNGNIKETNVYMNRPSIEFMTKLKINAARIGMH